MKIFIRFSLFFIVFLGFQGCLSEKTERKAFECPGIVETVRHEGYSLLYSHHHKLPLVVYYELDYGKLEKKRELGLKRSNVFVKDPDVKGGTALSYDYSGSGYDRGHMAPAADMAFSTNAFLESFYMSNICPQSKECNRKTWKDLEQHVRDIVQEKKVRMKIYTGPLLLGKMNTIGKMNLVSVPEWYYKILIYDSVTNTYIIRNGISKYGFEHYTNSFENVEKLTKINFSELKF